MSTTDPQALKRIEAAKRAVIAQAGLLHREFGRVRSEWKADGTRVTAADIAISEGITRALQAEFSGDQVFSEELAGADRPLPVTSRFCWVMDPIDGTNNYAAGIPYCAISLALLERGLPVYGVVYDLARKTLIHGGPGFGVWDGARPAQAKPDAPHSDSLIGFHSPVEKELAPLGQPIIANFKIRGLGSATLHLAYVAVGLLDGVYDLNAKTWDIAAAHALALAGGAEIHFLKANPFPMREFDLKMKRVPYLAGNAAVCARLRELAGIQASAENS